MEDEHNKDSNANKQEMSSPMDIPVSASGSHSPNIDASVMFPGAVPASPPSFVSLEQLLQAAEDVTRSGLDMALAHEIAVNRDFKLHEQQAPASGLEQKVSEMCHRAFWDLLSEQLAAEPPDYTQAMVLLKEIKEVLMSLLLHHCSRLRNEIEEVLDLSLVEQQAKHGSLDVLSLARFVISTMARMCAPARDERVQALRQVEEVVPLYKGILETLDLMKVDMVNFTIATFRPDIRRHSVEYERKKFREILASLEGLTPPVDGLRFTRLWLQAAFDAADPPGAPPSSAAALRRAYIDILQWDKEESFPETLHLDHQRFIKLKDDLTVMVLTATVILVTYSAVGTAVQGVSDFKHALKSHVQILLADAPQCSDLKAKLESVSLQVALEVRQCLERTGHAPLSSSQESALASAVAATSETGHHVRQLIARRVLEFLDLVLQSPSDLQIPPGLSSLQKELAAFAGQFLSLVQHNRAVFCEYYDDILERHRGASAK